MTDNFYCLFRSDHDANWARARDWLRDLSAGESEEIKNLVCSSDAMFIGTIAADHSFARLAKCLCNLAWNEIVLQTQNLSDEEL